MPPQPPRKYYIVTVRGERGPVDRAELKDLVRDGGALLSDQVRTATGRPVGTVAEVLAQVRVKDTADPASQTPADEAPPAPRGAGSRSDRPRAGDHQPNLRLAIAALAVVAVIALVAVAWAVGRTTAPPVVVVAPPPEATPAPPAPAPPVNPVAVIDSPLHPLPGPAAPADPAPAPASAADPAPVPLAVVRDVMLWDGEACAGGQGWFWPTSPPNSIVVQDKIAHSRRNALCFHGEGRDCINAGWGWATSTVTVDFTRLHAFVVSMKIVGTALPTSVQVILEGDGKQSRYAELMDLCPDLANGQWHDVAVPFTALMDANTTAAIYSQVQFNTAAKGPLNFDLYIDDLGYADDAPGKR
jgi:hypothetical protein